MRGTMRTSTSLARRVRARSIGGLENLARLDLRANRLKTLPAEIGELPKLEKLDLRWNKLSSVPPWIWKLKQHGCTVYR